MPAEWEPHAATWIAWPHNPNDWPGRFAPIPWVYAEIIRHLAVGELVHIICQNAAERARALRVLRGAQVSIKNLRFHLWPTDRVWTRDTGAIFLKHASTGRLAATCWKFNAWAKYNDWKKDCKIAARMAATQKVKVFEPEAEFNGNRQRVVLEGGGVEVNGQGLVLVTEEWLLSKKQVRNPGLTREGYESVFRDYLGAEQVIWLNRGIVGDDTHGHIDDLARFVAPNVVVTAIEPDPADENHLPLQENLDRLRAARGLDDKHLQVHTLKMPAPVVIKGQRVPASYSNFYIANKRVLVPTFDDPYDRHALNTLAELFPKHEVVGINCTDFIWGLGAVHCMTQQQPA